MKQIKLPNDLKELLNIQGVSNESIKLVEEHYSDVIYEVAKEVSEDEQANDPANKEKQFRDATRKIAEESRLVK